MIGETGLVDLSTNINQVTKNRYFLAYDPSNEHCCMNPGLIGHVYDLFSSLSGVRKSNKVTNCRSIKVTPRFFLIDSKVWFVHYVQHGTRKKCVISFRSMRSRNNTALMNRSLDQTWPFLLTEKGRFVLAERGRGRPMVIKVSACIQNVVKHWLRTTGKDFFLLQSGNVKKRQEMWKCKGSYLSNFN